MTRIWIMSDLHLADAEALVPAPPPEGYDVVVLAGDIAGSPIKALMWAARTFMKPAVLVAGNHEFHSTESTYERRLSRGLEPTRKEKYPGTSFLENTSVVIAGTRFLGSTLWTDFAIDGDQALGMHIAGTSMPDYQLMPKKTGGWMTAGDILETHRASIAWLDSQFAIPFAGPTVVVTHHAPSRSSVPQDRADSLMNPAFASNLDNLILRWQPDVWVHGHIHSSTDVMIGRTRLICNPRMGNAGFQPHLVVDVKRRAHEQLYEDGVAVDEYGYPMPLHDLVDDGPDPRLTDHQPRHVVL